MNDYYTGTRYDVAETLAIENARKENPDTSQRGLARLLYFKYHPNQPGHALRHRPIGSIYAAIRRHDAARRGQSV